MSRLIIDIPWQIKECLNNENEWTALLLAELKDIVNDGVPLEREPNADSALKLLAEWAVECGFGYDNIPDEYEKYKDDIVDMGYAEGLVYIVKMEVNK